MTEAHIPSIAALEAVQDPEVAFYAVVGAAMSLAANLELSYFRVFYAAAGLGQETAARVFYAVRNASTRRDMADAAIRSKLSHEGREKWINLYGRIVRATGNSGHRNLIGHARVLRQEAEEGGFDPNDFDPDDFDCGTEERFTVVQDETQVMARTQKERSEDFESLLDYCRELVSIIGEMESFMNGYERGELCAK